MYMSRYQANTTGRCPHCLVGVRFERVENAVWFTSAKETILAIPCSCPECGRPVVTLQAGTGSRSNFEVQQEILAWPLQSSRPVPPEVPDHIADDYREAAIVLQFSPKASAALSRRCLQAVLREAAGATQHNLAQQIDAVLSTLPTYVSASVDHVRNFAAHPLKDQASGQIVEVEPGEAEWNLDVLDMLFDHYYVKPEQARQKRDALDAKLQAAGKPPMKA